MRLWHEEALISTSLTFCYPRPQLLQGNIECCALRGNGWGEACDGGHVFTHSPYRLYAYHRLIMEEMAGPWLQCQSELAGQGLCMMQQPCKYPPYEDLPCH